jgi:rhodanese-related sulfurtransferase
VTRWIENVSWDAVKNGFHSDMGQNAMLIQIADPATFFPVPKHTFKEVHQFEFLDAEDGDRFPDECMIQDDQAAELVRLLQHALDKSMNVLVHCHAGICRSGAVVEVGSMMGFTPTERFRMPNLRVKHRMMRVLGLTYDSEEKQEAINGVMTSSGIILPKGEWE